MVILELIHAEGPTSERDVFISSKTSAGRPGALGTWVIHDNFSNRTAFAPATVSHEPALYQTVHVQVVKIHAALQI